MDSTPYELNLEQQFHIRLMENSVEQMTREQMRDLLIQASRLIMVRQRDS